MTPRPDDAWVETSQRTTGRGADHSVARQVLEHVGPPAGFRPVYAYHYRSGDPPRRWQPIVSYPEPGAPSAAYVQVTTATATEEEARQIARGAVERRLAACAQVIGPITSTYWWQGTIETAGEWLCLLKTTARHFDAVAAYIRAEHSYDTPEITATPIARGSPDYLGWISAETRDHS